MTEQFEKNRNEWNLAVDRLKKISEVTSKAESMHYRSLKHREPKQIKSWANLIDVLSHQLDNYLIKRDHNWNKYSNGVNIEGLQNYDDILEALEEVRNLANNNPDEAIKKMKQVDKVVNYCRIKEGFDLPTQVEKIDPNTVAADKMR